MKYPAFICVTLLLASCATTEQPAQSASRTRKAYVAGEPVPIMTARLPELVPGALPPRVRYHFADDDMVNRLAERLKIGLSSADASLYGDIVMVQPGAWSRLKNTMSLDSTDASNLSMLDLKSGLNGGLAGGLQGRVFRSKHAMDLLSAEIPKRLHEDGGFQVRALRTTEMAKWWIYIALDIEEPTFVIESAGGHYRFIVALLKEKIFSIDELNGLPGEG